LAVVVIVRVCVVTRAITVVVAPLGGVKGEGIVAIENAVVIVVGIYTVGAVVAVVIRGEAGRI
jgi:hypothetical protein